MQRHEHHSAWQVKGRGGWFYQGPAKMVNLANKERQDLLGSGEP